MPMKRRRCRGGVQSLTKSSTLPMPPEQRLAALRGVEDLPVAGCRPGAASGVRCGSANGRGGSRSRGGRRLASPLRWRRDDVARAGRAWRAAAARAERGRQLQQAVAVDAGPADGVWSQLPESFHRGSPGCAIACGTACARAAASLLSAAGRDLAWLRNPRAASATMAPPWPRRVTAHVRTLASQSISLTRYLIEEQHAGHINADLRLLIEVVARACKTISIAVGKGALGGVLGDAGTGNSPGRGAEEARRAVQRDPARSQRMGRPPRRPGVGGDGHTRTRFPNVYPRGNYLLLFDPLDGSSNIDVNVSVGTIFSVLRCPDGVTEPQRRALPAARHRAGLRRLHDLRPEHDAGADHRQRHPRLHARPRSRAASC